MGSFIGRGNRYIQLVKVRYCKLPTNSKQLPAFPLEVGPIFELQSQRWETRVLPLCHCDPQISDFSLFAVVNIKSREIVIQKRDAQLHIPSHSLGQNHNNNL